MRPCVRKRRNTTAIITCFSYVGNDKYVFNPKHLRSDLQRILKFVLKTTRCSLQNIYILTDLIPSNQRRYEIMVQLKDRLESYLSQLGYDQSVMSYYEFSRVPYDYSAGQGQPINGPINYGRTIDWIKHICRQVAPSLKYPASCLYSRMIRTILPRIWKECSNDLGDSLVLASVLTNFILINGSLDYDARLRTIMGQSDGIGRSRRKLFFYYTGHGIRHLSCRGEVDVVKDICLVIPDRKGAVELYSRADLQKVLRLWTGHSFMVFDCCRAESLVELPFKISFNKFGQTITEPSSSQSYDKDEPDIIYLASTRHNQTCGFCVGLEEYGSIFTYHLIDFLERIHANKSSTRDRNFSRLYSSVEEKIQSYRANSKNPPQNMLIQLNRNTINEFPGWLFGEP